MLKHSQEKVKEFHKKFGYPISETPKILDEKRIEMRSFHLLEELNEFCIAENLIDQIDATMDIIYLALGNFVEMGIDGDKIFEIVHNANMNKEKSGKDRPNKQKDWESPEENIKKIFRGNINENNRTIL